MQADHSAVISARAISLEKALHRDKALAEVPRIIRRSQGDIDAVLTALRSASLSPSHAPFETPRTYGALSHRGEARGVLGHFLSEIVCANCAGSTTQSTTPASGAAYISFSPTICAETPSLAKVSA